MKTIDEIHAAFRQVHKRSCGDTRQVYMSIPPRPEHDADIIICDAIDELARLRSTCENLKEVLTNAIGTHDMTGCSERRSGCCLPVSRARAALAWEEANREIESKCREALAEEKL